jgi:hypothetical protein
MNADDLVAQLARNRHAFQGLLEGIPPEQMRWKPSPARWSALEVLNHLCDEERDDFRLRLRLLLEARGDAWPEIDPEGWVRARAYTSRDPAQSLADFSAERTATVAWLRGLQEPAWEETYDHPQIGRIAAGDLLASWAAHDFLHLRQLAGLCLEYVERSSAPYSVRYATP